MSSFAIAFQDVPLTHVPQAHPAAYGVVFAGDVRRIIGDDCDGALAGRAGTFREYNWGSAKIIPTMSMTKMAVVGSPLNCW
jgi:hypothetical protein